MFPIAFLLTDLQFLGCNAWHWPFHITDSVKLSEVLVSYLTCVVTKYLGSWRTSHGFKVTVIWDCITPIDCEYVCHSTSLPILKLVFIFIYLLFYVYVHLPLVCGCPWRSEEGNQFPGSTVPDGCEPPEVSTEKRIWVLFLSSKYSIA